MNDFLYAALWGLIIGAGGTAGGASLILLVKTRGEKLPSALLGLAGGIMAVTVFMDMLPHALEHGSVFVTVVAFAAGAAAMWAAAKFIPHKDAAHDESAVKDLKAEKLSRSGILLATGIAIHNLPQGIAVGSGVSSGFAFLLGILLLAHNVPEGMAMGIPLKVGGVPAYKIVLIGLLTALPTCVGALIGAAIGELSDNFICACTSFAAGSMIYLTISELIPQALRFKRGAYPIIFFIIGAAAGAITIWLTHS